MGGFCMLVKVYWEGSMPAACKKVCFKIDALLLKMGGVCGAPCLFQETGTILYIFMLIVLSKH